MKVIEKSKINDLLDVSRLAAGVEVKNYIELCKILGEPILPSGSNSQKAQYKKFARYFKWEKQKTRFIIQEIYDNPLDKVDGRINGNNRIYIPYIEKILLNYLMEKEIFGCNMTRKQLWLLLGMINEAYLDVSVKALDKKYVFDDRIDSQELLWFFFRCNQKLSQILFTALDNLVHRKLIEYDSLTMISEKINGLDEIRIANKAEQYCILEAEKEILKSMGVLEVYQVYIQGRANEYYKKLNRIFRTKFGWKYTYNILDISCKKQNILEVDMEEVEIPEAKMVLNNKILTAIDLNAERVYKNRASQSDLEYAQEIKELDLNVTEIPPTKEELGIFEYNANYISIQKLLSQRLIKANYDRFI